MNTRISRKRDMFSFTAFALVCAFVMFYSVDSLGANECTEVYKEYQHESAR